MENYSYLCRCNKNTNCVVRIFLKKDLRNPKIIRTFAKETINNQNETIMCLVVDKEKFEVKVAEKDIKCFKIMDKIDKWSFISMYQNFTYRFQHYKEFDFAKTVEHLSLALRYGFSHQGEFYLYKSIDYIDVFMLPNVKEYYSFGKGGFHSFADLEKSDVYGMGFVGVECIIPKGSRYIEGLDAIENKKAYFSEEITIVREVKFDE